MRIGFSTTNSWISRTIRWFTKAKASHTFFVYFDVDFHQDMVMEADWSGFRLIPFSKFEKANEIVAIIDPKVDLDDGFVLTLNWLGSGYDFGGLFGMAWVVLGRWLRTNWNNPLNSSRKQFCSESAVRVLQAAGYPGADKLVAKNTSPQDLLVFLQG